ncbi:hypothetical protein CBR_g12231 [Chara braunii]|uniref:Phospholipase D n=1 Tax=Chara braunii TaxID=69332 RepID=A0A388KRN1_CHABU|nr:hypothetical protein CBR_g12231 [Chara braunii]|eukprot:GBG72658.1 hypothetical protein CBR_g12231 [Chara braunii]
MAEKLLHGTLEVTIFEARGLEDVDTLGSGIVGGTLNTLGITHDRDKSDPYATVELSPRVVLGRTRVIKDTLNPSWNESFSIKVAHRTSEVEVHIRDSDGVGALPMGGAHIPVDKLLTEQVVEGWFPLRSMYDLPARGSIRVKLQFQSIDTLKQRFGKLGQRGKPPGVPNTFFTERSGNRVTLYQDAHVPNSFAPHILLENGDTYKQHRLWEDVYKTIVEAKHFIYICGWSVYHKTRLIRDEERMIPGAEGVIVGNLLKKKADEGVKVVMLVWDDATSNENEETGMMATHDQETLDFFKGSAVKCVLAPRISDLDASGFEMATNVIIYSHHQKLVVADAPLPQGGGPSEAGSSSDRQRRVLAYVGGVDLCNGRFDTPDHHLFRTLDTWHKDDFYQGNFPGASLEQGGPRQPWHDIHSKVEGPAAWDVLYNFEQRWKSLKSMDIKALFSIADHQQLFQAPYSPFISSDDHETWNVQFIRSIDSGSVHGFPDDPLLAAHRGLVSGKNVTVERSIQDAYIHSIRRAEHFLYIENQYFLGSCFAWDQSRAVNAIHTVPVEIALRIVQKIHLGEPFAAYVVIPMWPEGVPTSMQMQEILYWQRNTMQMMYKLVAKAIAKKGLSTKPTDYLNFFCLVNREPFVDGEYRPPKPVSKDGHYKRSQQSRRFMIYVHSKMMIVDDEFIIVGSANINQRSMDGSRDSESAIAAYQPYHTVGFRNAPPRGQIHGFRMSLWAEHTGAVEDVFVDPSSPSCVHRINDLASTNQAQFCSNRPQNLRGHIVPYPIEVGADGTVTSVRGLPNFLDSDAPVLGKQCTVLPDALTT